MVHHIRDRAAWLRRSLVVAGATVALATPLLPSGVRAATAGQPLVNEQVLWIAVSPVYQRTGLVIATGQPVSGCTSKCVDLWVSHDGGYTWGKAKGNGWSGVGRSPIIAVDSRGHEALIAAADKFLLRSDDDGDNWSNIGGSGGNPQPAVSYPQDGTLAVALSTNGNDADYLLRNGESKAVAGSNGVMSDSHFFFANAGGQSTTWLSGQSKPSGGPMLQHCDANLSCSGGVTLAGDQMAGAPALYPSTTFAQDHALFAQTGENVFKSTNGGQTFSPETMGVAGSVTAIPAFALAPDYSESGDRTAYAAVIQQLKSGTSYRMTGGVYKTTNGGATWNKANAPDYLDYGAYALAAAPDGRLFAAYMDQAGHDGVYCSTDGGVNWDPTCSPVGSWSSGRSNTGQTGGGGTQGGAGHCTTSCAGGASPGATQKPAGGAQGASTAAPSASADAAPPAGLAGGNGGGKGSSWLLPAVLAAVLAVAAVLSAVVRARRRSAAQAD